MSQNNSQNDLPEASGEGGERPKTTPRGARIAPGGLRKRTFGAKKKRRAHTTELSLDPPPLVAIWPATGRQEPPRRPPGSMWTHCGGGLGGEKRRARRRFLKIFLEFLKKLGAVLGGKIEAQSIKIVKKCNMFFRRLLKTDFDRFWKYFGIDF